MRVYGLGLGCLRCVLFYFITSICWLALWLWACWRVRGTGLELRFDGWRPQLVASRFAEEGPAAAATTNAKKTDGDAVANGSATSAATATAANGGGGAVASPVMSVAAEVHAAAAAAEAADVAAKTAETMRIDRMAVRACRISKACPKRSFITAF